GSSNTNISHHTDVIGFDGIKYKNESPNFKTLKDACNYLLTNENKQTAYSLIELISDDYQLIDWQLDFRSGYRWSEKIESNKIRIGEIRGADIKVPWELARFQHLPLLAIYYAKNPSLHNSEKNRLVDEFCNEILDFIAFNPLYYGIHWKVAMEVSIRACNLILAYQIFKSYNIQFRIEFESIFFNFLQNSLKFIINNIEWSGGLRGNHYFTNISALLYISSFLGIEQYKELYHFALNEIINETLVQFNQDGGNFEGSFCYHLYTVEVLLWDILIANTTNAEILKSSIQTDKFKNRLQNILDYTYQMLGRKDFIPQIGDNDSGFFLGLDIDNNSLKNIKKILKFFPLENSWTDIQNIIIESDLYKSLDNYELTNKDRAAILFKESGIFIYQNKNYKIWIILGTKAQFGKGGHNHQDTASFILQVGDNPVIVDPGTYVYTALPEVRNLYRSYYSHNSYCPMNYEIKTREIDDLFWLRTEQCKFSINSNTITLKRKVDGLHHKRKFIFNDNSIEITDEFNKSSNGMLLLHLYPSIKILQEKNNIILLNNNIQLLSISSNNNTIVNKYYYSNEYGNKMDSKVIIFNNLININFLKLEIINGTTSK
ncbi:MAG TPA: heparinase II/III family protein, partial [Candidatus Kapabacteria bacterium]|nr:heparinase II/III family protein [Candidatus Kapabacteria bacterium]